MIEDIKWARETIGRFMKEVAFVSSLIIFSPLLVIMLILTLLGVPHDPDGRWEHERKYRWLKRR